MLRMTVIAVLISVLSVGDVLAMAKDGCGGDCASCHSLTEKEAGAILKGVGVVKSVKPAPVRGLFELQLEREGRLATAYMDYGKKNLIAGQIFDIASRQPVTPAVEQVKKLVSVDVSKIPLDNSLIMGNPNGSKRLFVFTDPDCPFCRKLHLELKKLVESDHDVAVYIKLFPLDIHPQSYDKCRLILGEKSLKLLDAAFAGENLDLKGTTYSGKGIDTTKAFAKYVGISSTPTVVFATGDVQVGYRTVDELHKMVDARK